jgi:hypothetical protein
VIKFDIDYYSIKKEAVVGDLIRRPYSRTGFAILLGIAAPLSPSNYNKYSITYQNICDGHLNFYAKPKKLTIDMGVIPDKITREHLDPIDMKLAKLKALIK